MSVEVELQDQNTEPKPDNTTEPDENADNTDNASQDEERESPYTGFPLIVDNFFGITQRGSNYRTETVAGLTTFMAMVYILLVNAGFFVQTGSITFDGSYIATAIGAIVGTLLMAFLARMPLAQASGMGTNAFCALTLVKYGGDGLTFANTMLFCMIDGIIFVILTATGLRQKIFDSIPESVKTAIPIGIGMFIAFIGFQQADVIIDGTTLVEFQHFNVLKSYPYVSYTDGSVGGMVPALVALLGVMAIAILTHWGFNGAILWGILGSTFVYYLLLGFGAAADCKAAKEIFKDITFSNPFEAFADWGKQGIAAVFYDGFNFSNFKDNAGSLVLVFITTALSLCIIDMFDTIGTLYGACAKGNLLDENGTPIEMNKMMLADAIATIAGAFCGTSTVTTFVESSSGVSVGGRTGFTALVVACCFFIAMFLTPIARLIPRCATATALIYVGILMMTSVSKINWNDHRDSIVAFLTFIIMALGYGISTGIGIGILTYVIVTVCIGKIREITIATWVIAVLFFLKFLLTD